MSEEDLITKALEVARNAYAPYSDFPVGAALLGGDGQVYTGCNVENVSYGLTMCAERVAIGKAVSEGCREFTMLAIVLKGGGSPCGACRQVLAEFAPELTVVLMANDNGQLMHRMTMAELLPAGFRFPSAEG